MPLQKQKPFNTWVAGEKGSGKEANVNHEGIFKVGELSDSEEVRVNLLCSFWVKYLQSSWHNCESYLKIGILRFPTGHSLCLNSSTLIAANPSSRAWVKRLDKFTTLELPAGCLKWSLNEEPRVQTIFGQLWLCSFVSSPQVHGELKSSGHRQSV